MLKVGILGLGLGYSLANFFASKRIDTIGIDINPTAFQKPRLDKYMRNYIKNNEKTIKEHISFSTDYSKSSDADIIFCFVETPLESNNRLGMKSVKNATKSAIEIMNENTIFVMMSTLPVGGSDELMSIFGSKLKKRYVYCPPMVRQENFLEKYERPPYLLLGHYFTNENAKKVEEFLKKFIKNPVSIWSTSPINVEICKLATNAFGTLKGVFFNNLATYAKKMGGDSKLVCKMVSSHNIVGDGFTNPGGAIGGVCLPRDLKEIYNSDEGNFSELLKKIEELNSPYE